jgi:hypothetical protein
MYSKESHDFKTRCLSNVEVVALVDYSIEAIKRKHAGKFANNTVDTFDEFQPKKWVV